MSRDQRHIELDAPSHTREGDIFSNFGATDVTSPLLDEFLIYMLFVATEELNDVKPTPSSASPSCCYELRPYNRQSPSGFHQTEVRALLMPIGISDFMIPVKPTCIGLKSSRAPQRFIPLSSYRIGDCHHWERLSVVLGRVQLRAKRRRNLWVVCARSSKILHIALVCSHACFPRSKSVSRSSFE